MEKTIEELIFAVFVTNGNAALIENDEEACFLQQLLSDSYVTEVTDEEEFELAAINLDFREQVLPRHIYRMCNRKNVNDSGYVVFSEDYGD